MDLNANPAQSNSPTSKLEQVTNIAVNISIVLLCLFGIAIGAYRVVHANAQPARPKVGDTVKLQGVALAQRNLILAVSTECYFCSESAGFYKVLLPAAQKNQIKVIAVLPQQISEAHTYFTKLGLTLNLTFAQSQLPEIRVIGTPTLMLLGPTGKIERVWERKATSREGSASTCKFVIPQPLPGHHKSQRSTL